MNIKPMTIFALLMPALLVLGVYKTTNAGGIGVSLSDAQIEHLVKKIL